MGKGSAERPDLRPQNSRGAVDSRDHVMKARYVPLEIPLCEAYMHQMSCLKPPPELALSVRGAYAGVGR